MIILSNFFSGSWIPKILGGASMIIGGLAPLFPQYTLPLAVAGVIVNGLSHFLTPAPIATAQAAQATVDKMIANGQEDIPSPSVGLFNKVSK